MRQSREDDALECDEVYRCQSGQALVLRQMLKGSGLNISIKPALGLDPSPSECLSLPLCSVSAETIAGDGHEAMVCLTHIWAKMSRSSWTIWQETISTDINRYVESIFTNLW